MRERNTSLITTISVIASLITIFGFATGIFSIPKRKPSIEATEEKAKEKIIPTKSTNSNKTSKSANTTSRNTTPTEKSPSNKLTVSDTENNKLNEVKATSNSVQVFVDSDGNIFTKTNNTTIINPVGEYSFEDMSITNNKGRTMLIRDYNKRTIKVISIEYYEESQLSDNLESQSKPIIIDVSNASAQVVEFNSPNNTNPYGYKVSKIDNSQMAQEKSELKPINFTGNWLIDQGVNDGSYKQSTQSRSDQIRAMQEIQKQRRGGNIRSMSSPNSPYLPARH